MHVRPLLVLVLIALVAAGCGDPAPDAAGGAAPQDSPAASGTSEAPEAGATDVAPTVAVAETDLGSILVDGDGRTLYLLLGDEQGDSTCYDDCAANWPVLAGGAGAGEGANAALLGETERTDGTLQTTYNGWPLYYFAGDAQPGDLNGQGVGEVWYVVDAAGEPVKDAGDGEATSDY